MNIVKEPIEIKGEKLILSNQRALFWPKENALVLSDLHVGKTATFKKHGIPISRKVLEDDLEKLSNLINHFNASLSLLVTFFMLKIIRIYSISENGLKKQVSS